MTNLTLTLQQPDQATMSRDAGFAIALVEAFEVVDAATYDIAADELKAIKGKAAALDEQRKAITKPLDEAKKSVMDLFRAPLEMLVQAEGILKSKMLTFQTAELKRAAEAREAAERVAREERAKMEAEAAALAAAGRDGEALIKQQVAQLIVAPAPAVEAPKAAGISTRTTVDFEVTDFAALVQFIGTRPELVGLLTVDSVKLRAYVKGLGMAANLPGVRVFEKATLAASRR